MPAHPLHDMLTRVIGELGQRFGTIAFAPHVTLCSGKWTAGLDDLVGKVDRLSCVLQPTTMASNGFGWGDKKTTFFYLRLDDDAATPLFTQAKRALPGSHTPKIGAHLSLIYAKQTAPIDRKSLAGELADRVPKQIDFGQLQLVTPVETARESERWITRHSVQLVPAVT